jgi:adenylate cyclase
MSTVAEYELGYLARSFPEGLKDCKHAVIEDIYFPGDVVHPKIRIRRKGDKYEFTKKTVIDPNDMGQQREENVTLTAKEYQALSKGNGKAVSKVRYFMPYQGYTAEIDVFTGTLEGLVIVEVEFETLEEKAVFVMPDFCLVDVTQEEGIAGGMLAGKSFTDVQDILGRYGYQSLHFS